MEEGSEAHWEVVQRILFLYAKLNPGQGYVQGMNEIIGPIYYTFATDPNTEWRGNDRYDFMIFLLIVVGNSRACGSRLLLLLYQLDERNQRLLH
jgi:multisubunit Na+/H+ antiporter MnhB subunit